MIFNSTKKTNLKIATALLLVLAILIIGLFLFFKSNSNQELTLPSTEEFAETKNKDPIDLMVWQMDEYAPKIILPIHNTESPREAVHRYVKAINNDPDLLKMLDKFQIQDDIFSAQRLSLQNSARPKLLFIANLFEDMTSSGVRISRNVKTFSRAGAEPYVNAISADIGLTENEALEFRNKIAQSFNLLVALGGEDVSEELSGRIRRDDSKTIFRRDISELSLIKRFKEWGQGVFFGICRGHQIGAIADGHEVIEDLTETGVGHTHEHVNQQGQNSTEMQTWHHIYVEKDSLLARMSGLHKNPNSTVLQVNSIHHQAVKLKDDGRSSVIAKHETSGVEALQMQNGRGISVQFHPEFPPEVSGNPEFSKLGFTLIRNIVAYTRLLRNRKSAFSCSSFL